MNHQLQSLCGVEELIFITVGIFGKMTRNQQTWVSPAANLLYDLGEIMSPFQASVVPSIKRWGQKISYNSYSKALWSVDFVICRNQGWHAWAIFSGNKEMTPTFSFSLLVKRRIMGGLSGWEDTSKIKYKVCCLVIKNMRQRFCNKGLEKFYFWECAQYLHGLIGYSKSLKTWWLVAYLKLY